MLDPIANLALPVLQSVSKQKWQYEKLFNRLRRNESLHYFLLNQKVSEIQKKITGNPVVQTNIPGATKGQVLIGLLTQAANQQNQLFNIVKELGSYLYNLHFYFYFLFWICPRASIPDTTMQKQCKYTNKANKV